MTNHSDILIIGGGVIGLCSAYYLRQQGHSVTLLDKGAIGSGSSFGNAGIVPPSHSIPLAAPGVLLQGIKWMFDPSSPFYIKPRLDPDLIRWLWKFRSACQEGPMHHGIPILRDLLYTSRDLYQELVDEEDLSCDYEQKGIMMLYTTEKGLADGRHEAETLEPYGTSFKVHDGAQTRAVEPFVSDNVIGGIEFADDAHLNPGRFMEEMARRVEAYGVTIHSHTEVTGFEFGMSTGDNGSGHNGSGHNGSRANGNSRRQIKKVNTATQDFSADQVILATGSWSANVAKELNLRLLIQPAKGYSLSMPKPANGPRMPLIAHESHFAITPMGDTLRFAGTLELSGLNLDISSRRVEAIRHGATEYLKLDGPVPPANVWVGMRPCTPDGLPIISRMAEYDNLIVAAGHAMLGMAMGPVTGKLVAQLVAEEKPVLDLKPLRAERW